MKFLLLKIFNRLAKYLLIKYYISKLIINSKLSFFKKIKVVNYNYNIIEINIKLLFFIF